MGIETEGFGALLRGQAMSEVADDRERYKEYFLEIIQQLDVVEDELLHPEGRVQGGALAESGGLDRSGDPVMEGVYQLVRDTIEFTQRAVAEIVTEEEAEAGGTQNL